MPSNLTAFLHHFFIEYIYSVPDTEPRVLYTLSDHHNKLIKYTTLIYIQIN